MKFRNKLLLVGLGFVILALLLVSGHLIVSPKLTQASGDANVYLPFVLSSNGSSEKYIVIGWNDLGMHCYDQDYSVFSILPPYNTLWAQVIQIGDPPQIVTDTVKVEFNFPDNSESASKTNFWDYEDKLFGTDLPLNVGLKGVGLSGDMALGDDGNYFIAEGIPLTEFSDSAPSTPDPYQLAYLVAKDVATDEVLAETTIVAPVSSEMRCDTCHDDTDNFRRDILSGHDDEADTNLLEQADSGNPVLCASCHADPAIGEEGDPELLPLSITIHKTHNKGQIDCYDCHPGDQTQCLRDVMSQPPTSYWCTNCHGGINDVGDENRTPWTDLPRCETCHAEHPENANTLFRLSIGHGGMYCESCHNSTHAILPSREANDNLQSIALQGHVGQISECTVCHTTAPSSGGPHTP